jgi:hypothetical protein
MAMNFNTRSYESTCKATDCTLHVDNLLPSAGDTQPCRTLPRVPINAPLWASGGFTMPEQEAKQGGETRRRKKVYEHTPACD